MSCRARLALRSSTEALCGVMLAHGALAAAQAQETPAQEQAQVPADPGAPVNGSTNPSNVDAKPTSTSVGATANPTAKAAASADEVSTDPVPGPEGQTQIQPAITPPASDQGIVVTGIRASLATAAKIKRNSVLIVDSLSAEDVGKLPDVSIADALARLPGVTAQRVEGRDQNLSIRGLGPDFSTTLLNGREQVTTGDNRGVEYDQYPSEFFQNVNIYKSADASLIAPGIAGTVDLRQLRPLSVRDRVLVIAGRGQMNQLKSVNPEVSRFGYRASGSYVDKFFDNTLGVALGFSVSDQPTQNQRYNAWGYATDANGNYLLGGAKPYVESANLKRYGAVGTLEWQPNEKFHSTFDVLYSHYVDSRYLRGIEFPLSFNPGPVLSNATFQNGFLQSGTYSNVYGVQRNDFNKRTANSFSLGWNNNYNFTDRLHLNVDASWSHAKRTDFLLETYSGTGYAKSGVPDTLTVDRQSDGTYKFGTALNYADASVFKITDPQGWGFVPGTGIGKGTTVQAGYYNRPSFKDDLKALRGTLTGDIDSGILKGWEVGGNYSRRTKDDDFTSFFLCPKGGGSTCALNDGTPTSVAVPSNLLLSPVALGYLGIPQMLTYKQKDLLDNVYKQARNLTPGEFARRYRIVENVWTGYVKLNFDGEVGGKAFKGSAGVQAVHTNQKSTGVSAGSDATTGDLTLVGLSGQHNYWNVLPSATMSVELLRATYMKMGVSHTIIRPRMDQEKVTTTFNINTAALGSSNPLNQLFSRSGGNIDLEPYQSTNIDLSFEKYFPSGGYVALAGYFKKLTDFIDPNQAFAFDASQYVSLLTPAQQAQVTPNNLIGLQSSPANAGRGSLAGIEATVSLPLKAITQALDGFGIFATGTYTDSQIRYQSNPTQNLTVPGLSKYVYSLTAFYEKNGFQARVNYRYRSKFLAEIQGLSADPTFRNTKPEAILDAQIGYEFQKGALKGLSLLLQGKNLTDRPFVTYNTGDPRQIIDYQRYGRDFYVGATYKF